MRLTASLPKDETTQTTPSPFDAMAAGYDTLFTHARLGTLMRQAVTQRLAVHFGEGDRVLELNCGTGEDALFLGRRGAQVLATDASDAMIALARSKAEQAGLSRQITARQMAIEHLTAEAVANFRAACADSAASRLFDGALSNFGGLNCVDDLRPVADVLAACVKPGGIVLLCLMGPTCVWEWGWYLVHGSPRKAFRRLRRGGVPWRGLTIHYPSLRAVRKTFGPHFQMERTAAVGALLPPTYAEGWAARHPRLLTRLNAWERRIETWPLIPNLADHYLIELRRKTPDASAKTKGDETVCA